MQNTINTIIKYTIITGLAIVPFIPLYVANLLFFPFITGKAFAFRIIVEIIFVFWLVLVLREKGTSVAGSDRSVAPRVNTITIFVTVFALVVLITDLLGVNPLRSIWSNSERMEGFMTIAHLWAYFMVLSSVFGSGEIVKKDWFRFLNIILFAGTIVSVYGLFQSLGWADIHQGSTRVDASLGNSAYMAVYMLINAFIAGYMAIVVFSRKSKILIGIYSFLAIFFSFIMFQTATRGTILGWIGAIFISCVIYIIFGRKEKGQSNRSRMIVSGIMLAVIILSVLFYFNRNAEWIKNNQVLGRIATISISDVKTQARGYVWPMALKGVFENPKTAIFGWGQENFNYIFNEYYNPKMWAHEQWFDRAHSVFIDWLVAGGLLGLISYLALYIISLIYICKSDLTIGQKSILIGLIIGYGMHNIFVFDNQTSYVMFFTFLAFVHSFKDGKKYSWLGSSTISRSEDSITVQNYISVPIIIILFGLTFYFVNIRVIQANSRLIKALYSCIDSKNLSTQFFENALKINSYTINQEAREQLISCSSRIIGSNVPSQIKTDFYNLTKKEIENQIIIAPNDARVFILSGTFFNNVGDWNNGRPLLERAHELSPAKQSITFDLVNNYVNSNKIKEALELIKKAYEDAEDNPKSKSIYVLVLIGNGEEKKAREMFGDDPTLFINEQVISIYASKKQFNRVIEIYKQLVLQNPTDVQMYVSLAATYMANNQSYLAISELRLIKEKFPEAKDQVDALIKQIQEGKNPLQ
ncbi:MAG: O-antigen ligase family protein [Patescibacteria group bacterium]